MNTITRRSGHRSKSRRRTRHCYRPWFSWLHVYVTGRSKMAGDASLPGTISATAAALTNAGGHGIAVRCDHGEDSQVKALFERIERERGRLDILVNNACAGPRYVSLLLRASLRRAQGRRR
jgi:NAD(P)-dependent dehydrogenase (short-subunit alcohol dehydrogenase family)